MKEIEATRPSLEVLREFDSCFSSTPETGHRKSDPNILASRSTADNDNGDNSLENGPKIRSKSGGLAGTKTAHWTSVDSSGVISMYDYDALKFDREFIVKEASLGLTSLEPNLSGSQVKLNELDLSKYFIL